MSPLSDRFPPYVEYDPSIPVYCVTPKTSGAIHRFFDTSPFSPSGRYMALTRFPFEDRLPQPGDVAQVLLIDLVTGERRAIAETRGWDTQLGAQVQWGGDDRSLFYNDVDPETWTPFGVKMDPLTGERLELEGTVYMVSPDGARAASPCLLRTGLAQAGYGVIVPPSHVPRNHGASAGDGLYVTDTRTGKRTLLVSIKEIVETAQPRFDRSRYAAGDFCGFHVKWNPQGTRLMFVLRWVPWAEGQPLLNNVITMDADGGQVHVAMPDSIWCRGGHHPNWCPDGEHVMMNLVMEDGHMRFVRVRYDGSGLEVLGESVLGSGHPTMHPDGRHILTDVYCGRKPFAFDDGTVPIRWVDLESGTEEPLLRIRTLPDFTGPRNELRIDPHPAWDRAFKRFAFNACPSGKRQVFVAALDR